MDFYNLDDVEKYIMDSKEIKKTIKKVADDIVEQIKEFISREWYEARPESEYYDRTYQLLSAFRVRLMPKSARREYGVKIYIDTSRISPEITESGKWNIHASQVTNEDVSEAMPLWIDEGNFDSPLYAYEGIHYMDELDRIIEETNFPLERFRTYLKDYGYVIDF